MYLEKRTKEEIRNIYNETYNNISHSIDLIPHVPTYKTMSFGTPQQYTHNIDDINVINNYLDNEKNKLLENKYISNSGLIDINEIDDKLIENVPGKTTAFEYISNASSYYGNYVYAKSAPVTTTVMSGIGHFIKNIIKN